MSARTRPQHETVAPIKFTMEFNTKHTIADLSHAPYFLAQLDQMPRLEKEKPMSSTSIPSSQDLISANRPIRRRRKRKRFEMSTKAEKKESPIKSSPNSSNMNSKPSTYSPALSITEPSPPPLPPQPPHPPRKLRPKFFKSNVSPIVKNRVNMLFSDSDRDNSIPPSSSSSSSPSPSPTTTTNVNPNPCKDSNLSSSIRRPHFTSSYDRVMKRRKITPSIPNPKCVTVSNSNQCTTSSISLNCNPPFPYPYRRKKSLFRSKDNSRTTSPSIESSISVTNSRVNRTFRTSMGQPHRSPLEPIRIQPSEQEQKTEKMEKMKKTEKTKSFKPRRLHQSHQPNCFVPKSKLRNISSDSTQSRSNILEQTKIPIQRGTRRSNRNQARKSSPMERHRVIPKMKKKMKKKYKVTLIEEDEWREYRDGYKSSKKGKEKSPKDMINGTHVHEYEAQTISKRTRKARRIQEQYNRKIQQEYQYLEKDKVIRNGKAVDVVCLD